MSAPAQRQRGVIEVPQGRQRVSARTMESQVGTAFHPIFNRLYQRIGASELERQRELMTAQQQVIQLRLEHSIDTDTAIRVWRVMQAGADERLRAFTRANPRAYDDEWRLEQMRAIHFPEDASIADVEAAVVAHVNALEMVPIDAADAMAKQIEALQLDDGPRCVIGLCADEEGVSAPATEAFVVCGHVISCTECITKMLDTPNITREDVTIHGKPYPRVQCHSCRMWGPMVPVSEMHLGKLEGEYDKRIVARYANDAYSRIVELKPASGVIGTPGYRAAVMGPEYERDQRRAVGGIHPLDQNIRQEDYDSDDDMPAAHEVPDPRMPSESAAWRIDDDDDTEAILNEGREAPLGRFDCIALLAWIYMQNRSHLDHPGDITAAEVNEAERALATRPAFRTNAAYVANGFEDNGLEGQVGRMVTLVRRTPHAMNHQMSSAEIDEIMSYNPGVYQAATQIGDLYHDHLGRHGFQIMLAVDVVGILLECGEDRVRETTAERGLPTNVRRSVVDRWFNTAYGHERQRALQMYHTASGLGGVAALYRRATVRGEFERTWVDPNLPDETLPRLRALDRKAGEIKSTLTHLGFGAALDNAIQRVCADNAKRIALDGDCNYTRVDYTLEQDVLCALGTTVVEANSGPRAPASWVRLAYSHGNGVMLRVISSGMHEAALALRPPTAVFDENARQLTGLIHASVYTKWGLLASVIDEHRYTMAERVCSDAELHAWMERIGHGWLHRYGPGGSLTKALNEHRLAAESGSHQPIPVATDRLMPLLEIRQKAIRAQLTPHLNALRATTADADLLAVDMERHTPRIADDNVMVVARAVMTATLRANIARIKHVYYGGMSVKVVRVLRHLPRGFGGRPRVEFVHFSESDMINAYTDPPDAGDDPRFNAVWLDVIQGYTDPRTLMMMRRANYNEDAIVDRLVEAERAMPV